MPNSSLPAQSSAQTVVTANTDTTAPSQSPTININLPKLPSSALRDPNHAAGTLDSPEDISKVSAHKQGKYGYNCNSADSHTGFCAAAHSAAVFYVLAFTPAVHSHSKEYFCKVTKIMDECTRYFTISLKEEGF